MRNLAEQAKIVRPIVYALLSWLVFLIVIVIAYAQLLFPNLELLAPLFAIERIKTLSASINETILNQVAVGAVAFLVLFVLPILFVIHGFKKRYTKNEFADGIDKHKLKVKDHYILNELVNFFITGGMTIRHGLDAEEIVSPTGKHFASIKFIKNTLYVIMRKETNTSGSSRPDRSGYIPVDFVETLETAKKRIYDTYVTHFKSNKPRTRLARS
ncbi:MAG: hypothetical protein LBU04_03610 [Christensenellaceae bacterium]|nr:hypothetical protein [Christensenellaceae bacterium]